MRRIRRTTAQQYFRQRMTQLIPVKSDENTGNVRLSFSLQNTSDGAAVGGFDGSTRWGQTYKNYESYAIKGLKLQWIPTNARGGVSHNVQGAFIDGTGEINSYVHSA